MPQGAGGAPALLQVQGLRVAYGGSQAVKGIDLEAEFGPHMLYITNEDKPGFIGALGTVLGNAGVNIATFNLGRVTAGEDAAPEQQAAVRRLFDA